VVERDRREAIGVGAGDGERLAVEEREGGLRTRVCPTRKRLRQAEEGYAGTNVSGKTTSPAPRAAASAVRSATRSIVAVRSRIAGSTWTQATVIRSFITRPSVRDSSSLRKGCVRPVSKAFPGDQAAGKSIH